MQQYDQRNYLPSYIEINAEDGNSINPGGIGSNAHSRLSEWFFENTLNYSKQWGSRHALSLLAGQSYQTTKYSWFRATASGYPDDNFLNGLSSATTPVSVAGEEPDKPQSYLLSFYTRANYSYMDRYLLTFTGRTDASSRFGPGDKYGYFLPALMPGVCRKKGS